MNNKIALILLFLVNSFLFAQDKYEPGTVHYKNGNTKKGFIEYYNKSKTVVLFKRNLNDTPIKLTPNTVTSYTFENLNKKIISENIETYQYKETYSTNNTEKKITTEIANSTSYFLEVLVEGKANLLFLDTNTNKKRYFLKSDKSGLKELDIITRREKNSQTKNYYIKRYIGILSLEFNDCETLKSKIEKLRLTQSDLSKAFIQYNNCTGEITFESERLNRKNLHKIIIEAGLYSSKIKTRGTSLRGSDFDNSINPGFGIHYLYTPTALSSAVSLSIGASYN
ncbi:CS1 type fimbrial major subunit [Aquimarina sediminis]|uniref:CS1 type fimbrial major subunit n=1 Tax=Aquimarina sediminis TaxID=2070536 RepID=UPI000CA0892F|nr:CS1 type fimbrial major subunit [Aquimarina sediminis]